jgi:predicted ATPase
MQAWRLLQLEPSALRKPDEITAPRRLGADGAHLPATLHRLAGEIEKDEGTASQIYAELANQLSELINDVQKVQVDRDEKRDLLTLEVVDRDGTAHPARSLSDGTLRFLALSILGMDKEEKGLLCLEEPENGIHPERIPAMLRLLQDIATDTDKELGTDNPLNQVIINTHSPAVVAQIPDHSLLVAESREYVDSAGKRGKGFSLSCLDTTWRAKSEEKPRIVSKGKLLAYLNPVESREEEAAPKNEPSSGERRVIDRIRMQPMLLPGFVKK